MSTSDNETSSEIVHRPTKAEEKDETYEYIPPDGGWGWLIISGCMLSNILATGSVKCLGIFLLDINDIFNPSPTAVSWFLALAHCFLNCIGPLTSYLCDKFGFRVVATMGGVISASGFIIGAFSTSVEHLYLTFGILVGCGAGLTLPIYVLVIPKYFVRLRGFANGFSVAGCAVGTIILPPVIRFLLETFGFRGASILVGGLNLNILVAAALYDPIQQHVVKVPVNKSKPNPVVYKKSDFKSRRNKHKYIIGSKKLLNKKEMYNQNDANLFNLSGATEPFIKERDTLKTTNKYDSIVLKNKSSNEIIGKNNMSNNPPYIRKSLFSDFFSTCCKNNKPEASLEEDWKSAYARLFRNPVFVIMIVSYTTTSIGYSNFTMLLPIYGHSLGFDKNRGSYLLSIVAMFDLIGRIVGGTLSDWLPIPKKSYYIIGLFLSGVFLCCMTFHSTYLYVSVFCALFGLAAGFYIGVVGVVMADLLGEDNLGHTFGLALFLKGICNFVSPPIFAYFYQVLGSYRPVFLILGFVHMFGALIWLYIPCKSRKKSSCIVA